VIRHGRFRARQARQGQETARQVSALVWRGEEGKAGGAGLWRGSGAVGMAGIGSGTAGRAGTVRSGARRHVWAGMARRGWLGVDGAGVAWPGAYRRDGLRVRLARSGLSRRGSAGTGAFRHWQGRHGSDGLALAGAAAAWQARSGDQALVSLGEYWRGRHGQAALGSAAVRLAWLGAQGHCRFRRCWGRCGTVQRGRFSPVRYDRSG